MAAPSRCVAAKGVSGAEEHAGGIGEPERRVGIVRAAQRRRPGKAAPVLLAGSVLAQAGRHLVGHPAHHARHQVVVGDHREPVVHPGAAVRSQYRPADEAVPVGEAPRRVVAVHEACVVLVGVRGPRGTIQVVRGVALGRACRRVGEAVAGRVASTALAGAGLRRAGRVRAGPAIERRSRREDHRDRPARVRRMGIGQRAVVDDGAGVVADRDRAERGLGSHVEAGGARRAVEQALVLARDRVPEALAGPVAQVGEPQRLPRQPPEALPLARVAREGAAGGFGPAVVVEVGAGQVARAGVLVEGAAGGIGDERLPGEREGAVGGGRAARPVRHAGEGRAEGGDDRERQDGGDENEDGASLARGKGHGGTPVDAAMAGVLPARRSRALREFAGIGGGWRLTPRAPARLRGRAR